MKEMPENLILLPGVPADYVLDRLSRAHRGEVAGRKFASQRASAVLAVNAFAWFHHQPSLLPVIPGTEELGWPATRVEVEYCAQSPFEGHQPWLNGYVETASHLLGFESKRHEPFREGKRVHFAELYDRSWGEGMGPFEAVRDRLRARPGEFQHIDAAQLVKQAFGLVAEAERRDGRRPVLVYLYSEPRRWPKGAIALHRKEVDAFAEAVEGASVKFVPARWGDWVGGWARVDNKAVRLHGARILDYFQVG